MYSLLHIYIYIYFISKVNPNHESEQSHHHTVPDNEKTAEKRKGREKKLEIVISKAVFFS